MRVLTAEQVRVAAETGLVVVVRPTGKPAHIAGVIVTNAVRVAVRVLDAVEGSDHAVVPAGWTSDRWEGFRRDLTAYLAGDAPLPAEVEGVAA
ncbi:hypothetical protein HQ535_15605 [bacterium]|nr:hypothetical protein [bacterium]